VASGDGSSAVVFGIGAIAGLGILLLTRKKASAASRVPSREPSREFPSGMEEGAAQYASWHDHFAPLVGSAVDATYLHSGCRPDAQGNIQCDPETMRASAEKQLQASKFWPAGKPLDLATYTLARYMQGEIGHGTAEERVAVGEAAVNQARQRGQDVVGLLLQTQPNHLYGEINVPGKGNINHRWASTSADPSILTTLLADLVISGNSEDISHGADDQDGLEYKRYFPVPMNRILNEAASGSYWVGPIAGVDHWKTTLFRRYGYKPDSSEGRALIARAQSIFGNPVYEGDIVARSMRPVWPAKLPSAPAPSAPASPPAPAPSLPSVGQPFLSVDGQRVLVFGDSLSHPGPDAGPSTFDVREADPMFAQSSAPGAVLAASLLRGVNTHGQKARAARIDARVGRSARSFFGREDAQALLASDADFRPTKVIVMLGTNDIDAGTSGAALDLTKDALRKIRDAYRGMGAEVVAIGPPTYPNDHYTQGAAPMLAALRDVFGADRVLDIRSLTPGASRTKDGIHFTQAGAALVGPRLAQALTGPIGATANVSGYRWFSERGVYGRSRRAA
jgi:lysophospholipase L1-like esterase